MPVVPLNFRIGAAFQPLDDVKSIIKFDGVVNQASITTRSQDGAWFAWTANGAAVVGPFNAPSLGIKAAFVSLSDFDPNDVVGHPDASRLGQITLLTGQHRARTQYWIRALSANINTTSGNTPALAPVAGDLLGVTRADGPTVTAINAAMGAPVGSTNLCTALIDGCLFRNTGGVQVQEAVAICLVAPVAANNFFLEYITL